MTATRTFASSTRIPEKLRERHQWVVWRTEQSKSGKPTKVPYNAQNGRHSSSTDPATWSSFRQTIAAYESQETWDGIGYVFSEDDPYTGIDLDGPDDQTRWIELFDSYTERTPSGVGAHVIIRGRMPNDNGKKRGDYEAYSCGRFFTFTGHHIPVTPMEIKSRQRVLNKFIAEKFASDDKPRNTAAPGRASETGNALVAKIRTSKQAEKFDRLWSGDTNGYPSQSEADLGLCQILAFWTNRDEMEIDRLFRQSGLLREKWDTFRGQETYGERTVRLAIERTHETYDAQGGTALFSIDGHVPSGETATGPTFHLTDYGNAERLVHLHGPVIRYCHPWKQWFEHDGKRWAKDDTRGVVRLAKATVRTIYAEAAVESDDKKRKEIASHAGKSESSQRLQAMIELASSEPGIPVMPDQLDRDPLLLNVVNGTIDLSTGELRAHSRDDLITKIVDVTYDPGATCPTFLGFLDHIFGGNESLIRFVQQFFGYCLTGLTTEQIIAIWHGTGANGKTTLQKVFLDLLGDYASQTPTETLLMKRGESVPNDIAALKGARLVAAVESDDGRRLSESLVKQLTGGDRIAARFMRAEWFEYEPTFKIILATNHRPNIRGTDNAIWRRIRLVPFDVTIPDDQQDRDLPNKLRTERPGILAWAVEGCLAWQRIGLSVPEEVRLATAGYREEMDVLAGWLDDRCVISSEISTATKDLYASYSSWCEESGERPLTQQALGRRLKERGFEQIKTKQARLWGGIGLKGQPGVTLMPSVTHSDANSSINGIKATHEGLPENKRLKASPTNKASPDDTGSTPSQRLCYSCNRPLPTPALSERGYCDDCAEWVESKSRERNDGKAA